MHQEVPLDNLSDEEDQEVSDANIPILLGDKVRQEKEETIQEETEELPRVQKKLEKIRRKRREQEEKELEERLKKDRQEGKTIQENSDCVIDISGALQEDISNNITLDISENYKVVPDTAPHLMEWVNAQFFKTFGRQGFPEEITTFLQEHGEPSDEMLAKFFTEKKDSLV